MRNGAFHDDPARREHRRRFRIDGRQCENRLRNALETLEECDEAINLALQRVCAGRPQVTSTELRAALRLLVEGPKGEFR